MLLYFININCYILTYMKLFVLIFSFIILTVSPANAAQKSLDRWVSELRVEVIKDGIPEALFDESFAEFKPIKRVVRLDKKQPEGQLTLDQYLRKIVVKSRIENGKKELANHKKLLQKVSKKYGVPVNIIVALWGIETNYGRNTGSFNTIHALATLAYDGRRSNFFRKELINALKIMKTEKISLEEFEGSWAGAFGQCQFMPSSYLRYAVDFDKDGKRDIWNTHADIFASIANYLNKEGWKEKGKIKEGSHNFKVILRWNRSRYFATAVGKLAQEIGG